MARPSTCTASAAAPSNRTDVMRLRKEVGAAQGLEHVVAIAHEYADVPRLRVDVAGDVDHLGRVICDELPQERIVAALARRVDENRRLRGRELDRLRRSAWARAGRLAHLEDGLGVAGDERRIGQAVELGIVRRSADAVSADLDAGDEVELAGEGDTEQAGAAISIDEEAWRARRVVDGCAWRELRANVVDERLEHAVVALEERARRVLEAVQSAANQ